MRTYHRYETLEVTRHGDVVLVSMNRPEKLNAINGQVHTELSTIFAELATDADAGAVVFTGAGRAFAAGADIHWLQGLTEAQHDVVFQEARKIILDILELPQPLIAAVNGPAVGFGATLALFCDIVLVGESAKIGDPHVVIGLVAGDGGAIIWPWLVGPARAKEFLFTGEILTSEHAERIGLINRVVPDGELLPSAMELATRLAAASAPAIRGTKASINKILRETVNLVLDTSLSLERVSMASPAHQRALEDLEARVSAPTR